MQDNTFKSGFVSVIGRTNVGKSSIINRIMGEKIAVIANKPQTTRNRIKAILNRPNSQIIFVDTPGIHKPKSKLGNTMVETAFNSIEDVDIIVFVIEATSENIGKGDKLILDRIIQLNKKTILLINKADIASKENIAKLIYQYSREYEFKAVIPVSAETGLNIENVIEELEKNLNSGVAYYDKEEYTDQTLRQLIEETIREKALKLLQDEVPHGIYVETEKVKSKKTMDNQPFFDVEAIIYCLKESHKGIIIGKGRKYAKKNRDICKRRH